MTAKKIGHHQCAALVGHAVQSDTGFLLQQLVGDMAHGAHAKLADGQFAWIGLGLINHRAEALHRRTLAGDESDRCLGDQHDRYQIALRVVG